MELAHFCKYLTKYGYLLNEAYKHDTIEWLQASRKMTSVERAKDLFGWHTCCITTGSVLEKLLTHFSSKQINNRDQFNQVTLQLTPSLAVELKHQLIESTVRSIIDFDLVAGTLNTHSNGMTIVNLIRSYSMVTVEFSFDMHVAVMLYDANIDRIYWINSYGERSKVTVSEHHPRELISQLCKILSKRDLKRYNQLTGADLTEFNPTNELAYIQLRLFELNPPTQARIETLLAQRQEPEFQRKAQESLAWLAQVGYD